MHHRTAPGYYATCVFVSLILGAVTILAVDLMWMQYVTQWWTWGHRSAVGVLVILISVILVLLADDNGLYVIVPWFLVSLLGSMALGFWYTSRF